MIIYTNTLLSALYEAIKVQERHEKEYGYLFNSAYLATLRELNKYLCDENQEYTEII